MQFEISREDLLKLKHSSYEMYQFVISQKSADGDYCETLDIEKLKKECELGYFNVMDLFPKEKIISAYLEYVNPISAAVKADQIKWAPIRTKTECAAWICDEKDHSETVTERVLVRGYDNKLEYRDLISSVGPVSQWTIEATKLLKKYQPKKHQALKDFLEDNHNKKAVRIKVFNQDMFIQVQEVLFGFGCRWAGENPADYKENIFIGLYHFAKDIRYCSNMDLVFVKSEEFIDYCFKTEKFI